MKNKKIQPGSVVVFEPKNFNPEFWDSLPEKDRKRYYALFGSPILSWSKSVEGICRAVTIVDGVTKRPHWSNAIKLDDGRIVCPQCDLQLAESLRKFEES